MNDNTISETLVRQGDVSIRAFDDKGVIYRHESLEALTPITFYDIVPNQENLFYLGQEIQKPYQILAVEVDSELTHQDPPKSIVEDKGDFNALLSLSTYLDGVIKNQRLMQPNNGKVNESYLFLQPREKLGIHTSGAYKSVTLWCKPNYIHSEIAPRKLT